MGDQRVLVAAGSDFVRHMLTFRHLPFSALTAIVAIIDTTPHCHSCIVHTSKTATTNKLLATAQLLLAVAFLPPS